MKFVSNINLQQNQLQNAAINPLSSAPSSPVTGQVYFDTVAGAIRFWDSAAWTNKATDSTALSGQNAAYYLARANHTGTQTASTISDLATVVRAYTLDQFAAPAANVSMNSKNITNVTDPVSAQDAATKNYVDLSVQSSAAGIDSKPSVRVVAIASITQSGTQTIDGVAVIAGNRVLCTAQSTASLNGVWVVAAGAWSRATDADATGEITPGAFWFVEEGTTYGASQWRCSNTGTVTLGSTSITIVQFGASSAYSNGNGLALSGSVFSVTPATGGGLVVDATGVLVNTALIARKFIATIGDGSTTSIAVTHALGTQDIIAQARLASNNEAVIVDYVSTNTTAATFSFAVAPASNAIKVIIVG